MGLEVEEVGAAEMPVALVVVGVDRAQIDEHFDGAVMELVDNVDGSAEGVESASDLGEAEVADGEADLAMSWFDRPASGGDGRGCGGVGGHGE